MLRFCLVKCRLPLALRASGLLLALPKSRQKALGAGRGVLPRIVRGKIPCASRRGGVAQTVHPCTRHRERRRGPRIRASLHYLEAWQWSAVASAAGCRRNGAPCGAARVRRISPKEAAHDARPFAECTRTYIQRTPEHPREVGRQDAWRPRHRGCVSLVIFLCTSKESNPLDRRSSGSSASELLPRVETLL